MELDSNVQTHVDRARNFIVRNRRVLLVQLSSAFFTLVVHSVMYDLRTPVRSASRTRTVGESIWEHMHSIALQTFPITLSQLCLWCFTSFYYISCICLILKRVQRKLFLWICLCCFIGILVIAKFTFRYSL